MSLYDLHMLDTRADRTRRPRLLERFLVATDGSESGDRAVAFAIALARGFRSTIEFCIAFDRDSALLPCCTPQGESAMMMPLLDELERAAKKVVDEARERARSGGVVATAEVLYGRSVETILSCANAHGFDAVIVGTAGASGFERFMDGSTADGVMRESSIPVFVVPLGAQLPPAAFERILLAIDDSEPSDAARDFAFKLDAANHASFTICAVAESTDGPAGVQDHHAAQRLAKATVERAEMAGLRAQMLLATGPPAEQIIASAISTKADLIAIGTHGRRGIRRWFVGSVAEKVVRESRVPVVVVGVPTFQR